MRIHQGTTKIRKYWTNKVHIFWEGHKNLKKIFHFSVTLQSNVKNFVAFSGYINFMSEIRFFSKISALIFDHIFFLTSFIEGKNDDKGAKACLATAAGWSIKPLIIPIPSSSFDQKKLLISDHVLSKVFPAFSRNPTSSSNDCRCSALNSSEL